MPSRGHNQDGGGRYSQSPLEPVLVNMVPAPDPEPRGGQGEGKRRLKRGGGVEKNPVTAQAHSGRSDESGYSTPHQRPPENNACAARPLVFFFFFSQSAPPPHLLPAVKGKCVRSERGSPLRIFLTAAGALGKEWEWLVGGVGVTLRRPH